MNQYLPLVRLLCYSPYKSFDRCLTVLKPFLDPIQLFFWALDGIDTFVSRISPNHAKNASQDCHKITHPLHRLGAFVLL